MERLLLSPSEAERQKQICLAKEMSIVLASKLGIDPQGGKKKVGYQNITEFRYLPLNSSFEVNIRDYNLHQTPSLNATLSTISRGWDGEVRFKFSQDQNGFNIHTQILGDKDGLNFEFNGGENLANEIIQQIIDNTEGKLNIQKLPKSIQKVHSTLNKRQTDLDRKEEYRKKQNKKYAEIIVRNKLGLFSDIGIFDLSEYIATMINGDIHVSVLGSQGISYDKKMSFSQMSNDMLANLGFGYRYNNEDLEIRVGITPENQQYSIYFDYKFGNKISIYFHDHVRKGINHQYLFCKRLQLPKIIWHKSQLHPQIMETLVNETIPMSLRRQFLDNFQNDHDITGN